MIFVAYLAIPLGQSIVPILDKFLTWRLISTTAVLVALSGFIQTFLLPETKYWYLLQRKTEKAETSELWFRPKSDTAKIREAIEKIEKIIENDSNAKTGHFMELIKNLRKMKYARPFFWGLILCVTRSSDGKGVFAVHLIQILRDLDIPYNLTFLDGWLGFFGELGNVIAFFLVYNLNRKTVIYISSFVLCVCCFVVLGYKILYNFDEKVLPPWVVVICVFAYMVVVDVAYNSSLSVLIAEIQVAYYRVEIVCFLNGLLYWLSGVYLYVFPYLQARLPIECLILFFLLNVVLSFTIVYFFFPETSDLEFYETDKMADLVCESEGTLEDSFNATLVPVF